MLGNWPRVHINANPSDEGFALGDFDQDSLLDVAATTGNSKRVEWYKNPGTGLPNWTAYHIGDFTEALFPDRTEVADINGDNRLDIIVTEENGANNAAETYWWEAPVDPTDSDWPRSLVVSQATTNSMDTADMDNDGDTDIILGEHRGNERVTIWENDGSGNLTEHLVGTGHESHLGAQAVDLDNDGDLDLVSIAFDDWQFIHLWRNDALGGGPNPTPTNTPLPTATNTVQPPTTGTPLPTATVTNTPLPTATNTSEPPATATSTPRTTSTTVPPTATNTPRARITETTTPQPSTTATTTTVPPTATATVGCTPAPGISRVTVGQQVLYLFDEGSGSSVLDSAGVGTPINLTIDDSTAVSWLPDGGLVINDPTIIQSGPAPTRLVDAVKDSNEITLEAWVIPDNLLQEGPARLVTLSRNDSSRNFMMGQALDAYEMRLRTTETTNNGLPAIAAPAGSATTALTHLVLTRQSDGQVALYVNNSLVVSDFRGGDFANWDDRFKMALANELIGDQSWLGTFHLVSVYDRALDAAEVDQNFQAGPRPDSDCGGFSAGVNNTAVNESDSAVSWLAGLIGTMLMGGLGVIGFQSVRIVGKS